MSDLPDYANFFSLLHTRRSAHEVAALFRAPEWQVRGGWRESEIRSAFAELHLDSREPLLLRGPVADVLANADLILRLLQEAGIPYVAESYDEQGNLLRAWRWPASPPGPLTP